MSELLTPAHIMVFVLFVVPMYLLPAIIVGSRGLEKPNAVILVNLLLGWTIVGWIVALIWAVTAATKEEHAVRSSTSNN